MKRMKMMLMFLFAVSVPAALSAQEMPETLFLEFDFEGFGNLIMMSPPIYSGEVIAGDPLVVGGTWWMEIDDSTWPPETDPATRWDYIWSNYFVYNPVSGSWTAEFDAGTLPQKPRWEISHPVNGTMGGTLVISFTIGDWDFDGILDIEERMFGTYEGTMMVMKYGTGNFSKYCGDGAYNGALQNEDPANWADDYVNGHCVLDLFDCSINAEPNSWGYVKSLYR